MFYIYIKQHDITDCGAACLAAVCKQYGLNLSISSIREAAGTDKRGTNVYGMVEAAKSLGFTAQAVKGDKKAFYSDFPLPCIAHVVEDEALLHYVVIHKITKKYILIADPAKGLIKEDPEVFFKKWTGVLIILVPTVSFEKGNKNKGSLSRFFSLLKPQKKLLINIFLSSLLITVFGIGTSFYFRYIMDEVVTYNLNRSLTIISIGVILLYLFKAILEFFRNHLMNYLSQKLDIPLILGYYEHTLALPMNFFGTRRIGEIVSRFMDASKIRDAISDAALTVMMDSLMAMVGGIVLYKQNTKLFFIAVILLILYGLVVFFYNKPIKNINQKIMEENAQVNSYLVESLNGIETIKSFNVESKAQTETEIKFIKLLKSAFKGNLIINSQTSIITAIATIGEVIILWVGTTLVLKGEISIGQLITFNALLAYFLTPVQNLINLQPKMQTAIVAADRICEILDLELEKQDNEKSKLKDISLKEDLIISNLDFRYGKRELILKNINMNIKAGEKIALVGESGSGKTTLAKLLLKFYTAEKGDIYFGNYNIKDINLDTLRNKIAYISQDIFLFSASIKDNLMLGNDDASFEDVIKACTLSHADEFINKLPLRYDTILEENGSNLSGGQKQRLAISRALLKHPDILIMDEATSNLDSITEKAIEKTIDELSDNITTIIIAHRLSTIMRCDKIFVLEHGEVIEVGNHHELMAKKGRYYNLWKEQIPE